MQDDFGEQDFSKSGYFWVVSGKILAFLNDMIIVKRNVIADLGQKLLAVLLLIFVYEIIWVLRM